MTKIDFLVQKEVNKMKERGVYKIFNRENACRINTKTLIKNGKEDYVLYAVSASKDTHFEMYLERS